MQERWASLELCYLFLLLGRDLKLKLAWVLEKVKNYFLLRERMEILLSMLFSF